MATDPTLCRSGKHAWLDPQNRLRCCNGYRRVLVPFGSKKDLAGLEYVTVHGLGWRGWEKTHSPVTENAS